MTLSIHPVNAPTNDVRDTIRLYDLNLQSAELYAIFNRPVKVKLVQVLDYLGMPGQMIYNKDVLVNNVVTAIQGLFPDKCNICDSNVCIQLGEKTLLDCVRCGQGAHTDCIAKICKIEEEDIPNVNKDMISDLLNPTKIPGMPYLCGACFDKFNEEFLVVKKAKKPAKKKVNAKGADAAAADRDGGAQGTDAPGSRRR